jgi:PAS domain S-box-containing protein
VLRAEGIRSFINVPLLAKGELIEVLNAAAREARVFTPEHIEIAQEFANTLALAMQQARLCREIEKHAAALEERVAQRTAELRESENRLRAVVTALPDLVFVVDEDGRYVEILTDDEQLLYRSSAELKGRTFSEVFPPELARQFEEVVRGTVQTERSGTIEYQLTVPAGEKWFEARTAFLNKRIDGKRCVVLAARNITDGKRAEDLENQRTWLLEELRADHNWGDMVGTSRAMQSVFRSIQMVGPTESTVLLLGETGTGKELIARALHHASKRHDSLMVKVNCAALPANLVESELFGHEKGAFTGATAQRRGRFEAAQNGTLFLDEVGELPPEVQVKLLRVLQEHEFERVGGSQTIKANARIIAATNRDLYREVQEGRFRADLFYRLNIFPIQVPPLRERREDIPLLARSFVAKFSGRLGKRIDGVSESTMQRLMNYDWPGNVRELENILERATILCGGPVLRDEHVGSLQLSESAKDGFTPLLELERQHIRKALDATGGVLAGDRGAARLLGLNRSTLWSRMQKLGISKPSE